LFLYDIAIFLSYFQNKGFKSNGVVSIGAGSISYQYNPLTDNNNALTLRSLSTNAKKEYKSNGKYHTEFQKFVNYYGVPDFGSKFVTAALDGSSVTFSTPGTFHFSANNIEFFDRKKFVIYGISSMILPMQVLGELENALDTCSSCSTSNCESINSLYKAVAYHTGSMEQTSLFQMGSQLQDIFYTIPCSENSFCYLGEIVCSSFGLCSAAMTTISVNLDIFSAFDAMKVGLMNNCSEALVQKEIVAKKILVVLIQYMLYYLSVNQGQTIINKLPYGFLLLGFTAATGVLPLVHFCNSTTANTIVKI
jgi:hypothetical protein